MGAPSITWMFRFASFLFRKSMPKMKGDWYYLLQTEESSYGEYVGMAVRYSAKVIQDGNWVYGRSEKIDEASLAKGTFAYLPEKRVQADFEGVIRFRFRSLRWEVELLVHESGHRGGRQSHGDQHLTEFAATTIAGRFSSSAADSKGVVYWSKEKRPLPVFDKDG